MSERRFEKPAESRLEHSQEARSVGHNDLAGREAPDDVAERRHRRFARGFFGNLRRVGAEAVAVTLGRLIKDKNEPGTGADATENDTGEPGPPSPPPATVRKLGMLHGVTERLRGAADSFVAAKLDEIEARVDVKLDEIEGRIDHKLVQIHKQLGELRDREIRHRLRLLKLTLIFTVLVGLLSLGYKWASRWMAE